ncbi:MAG: nicotinate phosphoribosyltransferase [Candidatus Bathyarchaeia archaeon]
MRSRLFHLASDDEIKRGETTDVYFTRTEEILKTKNLYDVPVVAEVTVTKLPRGWTWGVLCGVEEEAQLFEGVPVNVDMMPEGTVFYTKDYHGFRTPVMRLEGPYGAFCRLETPLLGLICHGSAIATAAAHVKKVAGKKLVINFGARRVHPGLAPFLGRAAYIGGLDGVSNITAAKLLGVKPTGTMPHSLIILFGEQRKAWEAFDELMPKDVPRIALVDTYFDEKAEAVMAAEHLKGRLWGVRLDTPGSRKGDFAEIIKEVRWELNVRGYQNVKIFVSGGLDEDAVRELGKAGADGFGVGTWISSAPVIDFAMDIVEMRGKAVAKRGKLGGNKQVWRCGRCLIDVLVPQGEKPPTCPSCGFETAPMLRPLIRNGKIVGELPRPKKVRSYVLDQLKRLSV